MTKARNLGPSIPITVHRVDLAASRISMAWNHYKTMLRVMDLKPFGHRLESFPIVDTYIEFRPIAEPKRYRFR